MNQNTFNTTYDSNACNHCWHSTETMLCSIPPQDQQICCHCGQVKNVVMRTPTIDRTKHGVYLS